MSETKTILQQCGIVSNTENNSKLFFFPFFLFFPTTVICVRTYLETVKQTLKTHNGTKEGKNRGGNLERKKITPISDLPIKKGQKKMAKKVRNETHGMRTDESRCF